MFLTVQRLLGIPLHCGRLLNRQHAKAVWHSASLWKTAQPVTCKGCFGFRFAVEDCSTGNVHRLLGIPLHCGKLLNQQRAKAVSDSASLWKTAQPATCKGCLAFHFSVENCSTSNMQRLLGIPLQCGKPATCKGCLASRFTVENCSTS